MEEKKLSGQQTNGVLGQSHKLGALWGNLKLVAQHANIYIQLLILGFSGVSAYAVIGKWLLDFGIQLKFWVFMLATLLIVIALTLFEWRFGVPSSFISWNHQWWEHRNPMRKELDEMNKKLDKLLEGRKKVIPQ